MKTKIIEVQHESRFYWGKFLIGVFSKEWDRQSIIDPQEKTLLRQLGWGPDHILIIDLSVGHGMVFKFGGSPVYDVLKKGIYVCPMFTPFLVWAYENIRHDTDFDELPDAIELKDEDVEQYLHVWEKLKESYGS